METEAFDVDSSPVHDLEMDWCFDDLQPRRPSDFFSLVEYPVVYLPGAALMYPWVPNMLPQPPRPPTPAGNPRPGPLAPRPNVPSPPPTP